MSELVVTICRDPFITVREASMLHRVPASTLYRWISNGTVLGAPSRVGLLVVLDSLEDHLRATRALDKRVPS